ncbi:MAG: RNA-binding S4 domain-containing protein [Neomegalonema sp.]|nr:RNA-binding S4 domain-containing protein [Neomegalonema sp.]
MPSREATEPAARQRLDKWLWCARFFKTRALSSEIVSQGRVRVNSVRVSKAGHGVKIGDVLTFAQANRIIVAEIVGFAARRGPASEAQLLYRLIEDKAGESGSSQDRPETF